MRRLVILLAACGGGAIVGPDVTTPSRGGNPADDSTATSSQVLRQLTGDATTIADDWTASEGGMTFAVVKDGNPDKPWISSEHFAGSASLAFTVPSDDSGHKERVEYKLLPAADPQGLHFDNARYTAFAMKLEPTPQPFLGTAIFWQAWQGFPWGPPVSLKFSAGNAAPYKIRLAIRNASIGTDSTVPDIELWSGDMIQPNKWYRFIAYVKPRPSGGGNVKLWIDGTKVLDWTGAIGYDPATTPKVENGLDLKAGLYQPDVNNGHTLYFDQVTVTTAFATANAALGQ
jgi:hypothetical protein